MSFKVRPSLIIGPALLILWAFVLTCGVILYVRYGSPRQLAALIATEIEKKAGLNISISDASPGFLPLPHLDLADVRLELEGASLAINEASVFLSLKSIFSLSPIPGRIILNKPALLIKKTQNNSQDTAKKYPLTSDFIMNFILALDVIPKELRHLHLDIENGKIEAGKGKETFLAEGIDASLHLTGHRGAKLDGTVKSIRFPFYYAGADKPLEIRRSKVLLHSSLPNSLSKDLLKELPISRADVSFHLFLPGLIPGVDINSHIMKNAEQVYNGEINLTGNIAPEMQSSLPISLTLPFVANSANDIHITNMNLHAAGDSLNLNGLLNLDQVLKANLAPDTKPGEPLFTGEALIKHFSLPRWFDFARYLPAGLEHALNNLQGALKFSLKQNTLNVENLSANICGTHFVGSGEIPNFTKPEIKITAHADTVDANTIFPELMDKSPKSLPWEHGAIFASSADTAGPDYNIQISASKIKAWKFSAQNFSLGINPVPDGVRLNIKAGNFYEGNLNSTTDITNSVNVHTVLSGIDMGRAVNIAVGKDILRGKMSATARLSGRPDSFDHFLSSLTGSLNGTIDNGSLGPVTENLDFNILSFDFKPRGLGLKNGETQVLAEIPYDGSWSFSLKTQAWQTQTNLEGTVFLDGKSLGLRRFEDTAGKVSGSFLGLNLILNGRFGFDLQKESFLASKLSGSISGGKISGTVMGKNIFSKPQWSGDFNLTTSALASWLKGQKILPDNMPPNAFRYFSGSGSFFHSPEEFLLRPLRGRLDDTRFSGTIERKGQTRAEKKGTKWDINFTLENLDLSRYLPETDKKRATDWPTDLLSGLRADGLIQINNLIIAKLAHNSVRIPFSIHDSSLICQPISFIPYGGRGEANFSFKGIGEAYLASLSYSIADADSARFCREAGLETIIGGKASLSTNLSGMLRNASDIPAALDGKWSTSNNGGFIATKRVDGSLGQQMPFRSLSASGIVQKGVLKNDDFTLTSDSLAAKGVGHIDLVNWTLDFRMNVSTHAFSNLPVRYTGSLDAPQRSINVLQVIPGTLNKVGKGVFGLVQDIFSVPFRIFGR